jgi:hypothetical protein
MVQCPLDSVPFYMVHCTLTIVDQWNRDQQYKVLSQSDVSHSTMPQCYVSEEHRSSEINMNKLSQMKRKRSDNIDEDDTGLNQPRQLRLHSKIDYRWLQKSFPDDSNEAVLMTSDIVYAITTNNSLGSNEPETIQEAK